MHKEFTAIAQGRTDYIVEVISVIIEDGTILMTILATEEAIYITKEQAMKFFNLVEKTK